MENNFGPFKKKNLEVNLRAQTHPLTSMGSILFVTIVQACAGSHETYKSRFHLRIGLNRGAIGTPPSYDP